MSIETEFLRDIRARPDDDDVRLIYADWLTDQGDPRGEFIHVQVDLGRTAADDPRRVGLVRREREMLEEYRDRWLEPIRPWLRRYAPVKLERGFLTKVTLADQLSDQAVRSLARSPWLALLPVKVERDEWARTASMFRVAVALDESLYPALFNLACSSRGAAANSLLPSPLLASVRTLNLSGYIHADTIRMLASSEHIRNIEVLRFLKGPPGSLLFDPPEMLVSLFESPHWTSLIELEIQLWHSGMPAAGIRRLLTTLAGSARFVSLRTLIMSWSGYVLDPEMSQALVGSPVLTKLKYLEIHAPFTSEALHLLRERFGDRFHA